MMSGILPVFQDLLCNHATKLPLHPVDGHWADSGGHHFPVVDGFPDLRPRARPLRHRVWEWVYNLSAFGYDFGVRTAWRLSLGGAPIHRESYRHLLEVGPGETVLETAVGTGDNLLALPPGTLCVGIDQSLRMLQRCRRKLVRNGVQAGLVLADMAALPFLDSLFDSVFHVGGVQFVSTPRHALEEMLRVARPGARVTVIDEAASLKNTMRRSGTHTPPDLAPAGSRDIRFDLVSSGELYALQFIKE